MSPARSGAEFQGQTYKYFFSKTRIFILSGIEIISSVTSVQLSSGQVATKWVTMDHWTTGLNCVGSLICGFSFNKYAVTPCILSFHICRFNQLWIKNSIFKSIVGNLQVQRANCMHCSTPSYIKDFSIHRFWYLHGPGTNPPWILKDDWALGESKVIHRFSTAEGSDAPQTPYCSRVNCTCVSVVWGRHVAKGLWTYNSTPSLPSFNLLLSETKEL